MLQALPALQGGPRPAPYFLPPPPPPSSAGGSSQAAPRLMQVTSAPPALHLAADHEEHDTCAMLGVITGRQR